MTFCTLSRNGLLVATRWDHLTMGAKATFLKIQTKHRNGLLLFWAFDRLISAMSRLGVFISVFVVYREGMVEVDCPELGLSNCTWGFATPEELADVASVEAYSISHKKLMKRAAGGAECFVLRHEGRIVAFTWWCQLDGTQLVRLGHTFGSQDAYLFNAHTAPSYRGRNLLPFLRYQLYSELNRRGRTNLLSATYAFDRPAHHFKRKLAARPLEVRLYLRLFGRIGRVFTLYRFQLREDAR